MLVTTPKMREFLKKTSSIPVAIIDLVLFSLKAFKQGISDWQAGEQEVDHSISYVNTTLAATLASGTTSEIELTDIIGFEIGDDRVAALQFQFPIEGYLRVEKTAGGDIGDFEIIKYEAADYPNDKFLELERAQFGTIALTFTVPGDSPTVTQHHLNLEQTPGGNLTQLQRGQVSGDTTGGPPTWRYASCFVYCQSIDKYLVFGGFDGTLFYNDVWEFTPSTRTWVEKTTITGTPPSARHSAGVAWDNDNDVLLIGGGTDAGGDKSDVFEYAYAGGTGGAWTTKTSMGSARTGHLLVYASNVQKFYAIGDRSGAGATFEVYDPVGDSWGSAISMDGRPQRRIGQAGGFHNPNDGNIYWFNLTQGGQFAWLHAINPTTDTYINKPFGRATPPKSEIEGGTVFAFDSVHNHAVAIGGGKNGSDFGGIDEVWSYIQVFNFSTETWELWKNHASTVRGTAWGGGQYNSTSREIETWGGLGNNDIVETETDLLKPLRFAFHWDEAVWASASLDLGEVPTNNGEWAFSDIVFSSEQSIRFFGRWSDDDIAFNDIGFVIDGEEITDLHRYYQIDAVIEVANAPQPPEVVAVGVQFDDIFKMSEAPEPLFGLYPNVVQSIPSVKSRIEPLKGSSSLSKFSLDFSTEGGVIKNLIENNFLKNKEIRIRVGFLDPDFTEDDFLPYNAGVVQYWKEKRNIVTLVCKDIQLDLNAEVPQSVEGGVSDVVYASGGVASHPIDIILDIILNQVNIRDSLVDLSGFDLARINPAIADWVFRRTLDKPFEAKELIEEINILIQGFLIPLEVGQLGYTLFDPTIEPDVIFDKNNIDLDSVDMESGVEQITSGAKFANRVGIYFGHATTGTDTDPSDFEDVKIEDDVVSQTNWGFIFYTEERPLWLGPSGATYNGDIRATDIATARINRSSNGIPQLTLDTNLSLLDVQVGDLIKVIGELKEDVNDKDAYSIPYSFPGLTHVTDLNFQVIEKNSNWKQKKIAWTLWRARNPLTFELDSEEEFQELFLIA